MDNICAFIEEASDGIEAGDAAPALIVDKISDDLFQARVDFRFNNSPFHVVGCDGETNMVVTGSTMQEAIDNLDALCATQLENS